MLFFNKPADIDKADDLLNKAIKEYERLDANMFNADFKKKFKKHLAALKSIHSSLVGAKG